MKSFRNIIYLGVCLTMSTSVMADIYSECCLENSLSYTSSSPSDSIRKHRRPARKTFTKSDIDIKDSFDEYAKKVHKDFDESKHEMERRFIEYRDSVLNDFVQALNRPWDDEKSNKPLPKPIDNSVGPQIIPDNEPVIKDDISEPKPVPVPEEIIDNEAVPEDQTEPEVEEKPVVKDNPVVEDEPEVQTEPVVNPVPEEKTQPEPKPQPRPHTPVEVKPKKVFEIPRIDENVRPMPFVPVVIPDVVPDNDTFTFEAFGTELSVALNEGDKFNVSANNTSVAETIKKMSGNTAYTLLLDKCLEIRKDYQLCDWAYLKTLETMSNEFLGKDTNEARLLTGYLFCMSGYKMRFGFTSDSQLILLGACDQSIVNTPYLTLSDSNGSDTYYVLIGTVNNSSLQICNYEMPGEKAMSLNIYREPLFEEDQQDITMQLHSYPSVTFNYSVNKNLMEFYDTYPTPLTKGDSYSKWIYYANTPMSSSVKATLYPAIINAIKGKSVREQTDLIMDFIESFKYGYDDEIWGFDRAFFPDETIFYPQSDCEDHAILLTRIVRDLLKLETALIYYPGHLAAAVCFEDSDSYGDYIMYNGKKYTICDPTIYYSGSGRTMRGMNNSDATLIIVK